jgi:Fe-S cluster biogenesis protein NfuA
MEHFMTGWPLVSSSDEAPASDEFFEPEHADLVETIKELLDSRIRPAVAGDGGDITFRGFRDGTVFLSMKGACSGCPSSTATLKHGIENLLRHYVPEVEAVEQI